MNHKMRLLHTTAIRLSLRYAFYFALLMMLGLGGLYWSSSQYIDAQITSNLEYQLDFLVSLDQQQGRQKLLNYMNKQSSGMSKNRLYKILISRQGKKLAGNLNDWPEGIITDKVVRNDWFDSHLIPEKFPDSDGYWPVIATKLSDGSSLLLTQSIVQAEDLREFTLSSMLIILLFSIALTILLGWRMGKTILHRMDTINVVASQIGQGKLNQRVPLSDRDDEFDELASHLNDMFKQLEQLINGMRDVTDNVAHDLRRPLSRLRNRIEVTLLKSRDIVDYQQTLNSALTDIDGLIKTFNALLEIAQVESGSYRGDWLKFDLSALTESIGILFKESAEEDNKTFQLSIEPDIYIKGNPHLLGQAINNLLENALKYTSDTDNIELKLFKQNDQILLRVSDSGMGIPPKEYERVLQRFVRLEASRSSEGNGLGLCLVKAVTDLHQADLILESNDPGLKVCLIFASNTN
ncbi:MAG: HAMP domain-containing histidine kinase [gamma proteobacterium symbiont of Bathyaustriella thionipta]|nr:HAMP domain-containing histidine kinase [gamma proteobacterium symbiont of Bathyaustriella thionipta]